MEPFEELGFAKLDSHRGLRQGVAEVIYGAGKTPEQIARIVDAMRSGGQDTILITRMSAEAAAAIDPAHPFTYYEMGRIGIVGSLPAPDGSGKVVVATGGTSDMPVAEEAALTAEALGNEVVRLYDVGVAGLHCSRFPWRDYERAASSSPLRGWRALWPASSAGWPTAR